MIEENLKEITDKLDAVTAKQQKAFADLSETLTKIGDAIERQNRLAVGTKEKVFNTQGEHIGYSYKNEAGHYFEPLQRRNPPAPKAPPIEDFR